MISTVRRLGLMAVGLLLASSVAPARADECTPPSIEASCICHASTFTAVAVGLVELRVGVEDSVRIREVFRTAPGADFSLNTAVVPSRWSSRFVRDGDTALLTDVSPDPQMGTRHIIASVVSPDGTLTALLPVQPAACPIKYDLRGLAEFLATTTNCTEQLHAAFGTQGTTNCDSQSCSLGDSTVSSMLAFLWLLARYRAHKSSSTR